MLVFAIDDDPKALRLLRYAIEVVAPEARVMDFPLGTPAIEAVEAGGLKPDIVFTEIRMPEPDGLALAARLKQVSPATKIVFVTADPGYALDAMYLHASGYILKPLQESRVREEIEHAMPAVEPGQERLFVRCFGRFEVYWRGAPLMFGRRQTKELLAYLVDREGATCTADEIAAALWEDGADMSALKHRIRDLISDLKKTLAGIGMEAVLLRRSGQAAIRRDLVDCDYYRMLDGDAGAAGFNGEYMSQYSWAENTAAKLHFHTGV